MNMLFGGSDGVSDIPSRTRAPAHAGEQSPLHKGKNRPTSPTEHLTPCAAIDLCGTAVASPRVLPKSFPTSEVRQEENKASSNRPAAPCAICGCPVAWESVYRDGKLRCEICDPPPSTALVGRRVTVVHVNGSSVWIPLDFVLQRAAERREQRKQHAAEDMFVGPTFDRLRDKIASEDLSATLAATWSPPDADGWCYAIDSESRERARQQRHLRDPTLQRLDESEAAWEERLAAMTRSAELAEVIAKEATRAKAKV